MCQATMTAYDALIDSGLLFSASTMVPTPWFPAAAAYCREKQPGGGIDMGVHLTLTSEWDSFRWGPISMRDPASGLLDDEGYLHRTAEQARMSADPRAAHLEMKAQIERALVAGIDVTHIDSHMFTNFHPALLPAYFYLASHYRVPALMVRDEEHVSRLGDFDLETVRGLARAAEDEGLPLVDNVLVMPLEVVEDRLAYASQTLRELPPGITCLIFHPVHDTPELRAMAPDWRARVGDLELFTNERWHQVVQSSGIQLTSFRSLRDGMRAA